MFYGSYGVMNDIFILILWDVSVSLGKDPVFLFFKADVEQGRNFEHACVLVTFVGDFQGLLQIWGWGGVGGC